MTRYFFIKQETQDILNNLQKQFWIKKIPITAKPGITEWQENKYSKEVTKCTRIYHHNTGVRGFSLPKLKKK